MISWWFDKQISKAAIAFPSYSGKSSMMLFGPKIHFRSLPYSREMLIQDILLLQQFNICGLLLRVILFVAARNVKFCVEHFDFGLNCHLRSENHVI